ncbi:CIC11C00000005470 [Sungouiella intermedia]|uniref:CIC11C00000005470 n=1 Tax=Sungouiella intermedia TaxID=45354 RepID=A0A1L0D4D0_9ASCO|nr:CIC11C00000005470 [[Candida] intermedia]
MNSQLDNTNDNQDQVLQETDTFRPVFFDLSSKRNSTAASNDSSKRVRLDASVIAPKDTDDDPQMSPSAASSQPLPSAASSASLDSSLPALIAINRRTLHIHHRHIILQHQLLSGLSPAPSGPECSTPLSLSTSNTSAAAAAAQAAAQSDVTGVSSSQDALGLKAAANRAPSLKKAARMPIAAPLSTAGSSSRAPKYFRRFRSRSLPIINYTSRLQLFQHHMLPLRMTSSQFQGSSIGTSASNSYALQVPLASQQHHHNHHAATTIPSLPPINLQSLKEIDLHEILKNPQLRHDILFDPQLQFRPNLDGERGRRKKGIIEKYWSEVENECKQFFAMAASPSTSQSPKITRLPVLFSTLRDILLSLLPVKDRLPVNEIMDIDLLVQQLSHGSFDFVGMAKWLGEVFKSHCAPMRDQWVSDMISKFQGAYEDNSVDKLVQGLRTIFSILEAMKLDVANHQIRILRPVLIETAVDFERDYFNQLINHCKIDISDSLKWFYRNYYKKTDASKDAELKDVDSMKPIIVSSIIDLLSCRNMASEFPSTLAFDHTRLVLLRADVRQLVCVQLCVVLYKQLLVNYQPAASYRVAGSKPEILTKVQEEILAIVTDDNGNVKWTRNVQAIALQLVKNVVTNPTTGEQTVPNLPQPLIDFSYNWLMKQIQPCSDVYGLMEVRIFKELLEEILNNTTFDGSITIQSMSGDSKPVGGARFKKIDLEMTNISTRISTLVKFHWSVFGDYYSDYLKKHKRSK